MAPARQGDAAAWRFSTDDAQPDRQSRPWPVVHASTNKKLGKWGEETTHVGADKKAAWFS
jgi:hypothetical protein